MQKKSNQEYKVYRRKPISGPAVIILLLVLIGLWYGGKTLSTTKTVTIESNQNSSNNNDQNQVSTTEAPKTELVESQPTEDKPADSNNSTLKIKLPEGYPSNIPEPKNGTLAGGYGSNTDNQKSFVVSYLVAGMVENVSSDYQNQLKSAGFNVDAFPAPGGEQFFGAEKDQLSLTVTVANDEKQAGSSIITINTVIE